MSELLLIVLAAALVNNFVLVQFLGLCPFMGASRRIEGAVGMGLATGLVLTTASGLSFLVDRFLLQPYGLQYLRILSFILVIGVAVQLTDILIRRFSPLLGSLARYLHSADCEQLRGAGRRAAELGGEPELRGSVSMCGRRSRLRVGARAARGPA